ncbi:MAG: carboxypeptidase-like regulatory domain-containing protein, partial [Bacteroidia bacterium]
MKFISFLLFLLPSILFAQSKVTISGYLKDATNGEALIGASVYSDEAKTGTASNTFGFYSLSVSPGTHHLTVSYIGYETQKLVLQVMANRTQTIQLQPSGVGLKGADITAQAEKRNVQSTEMGVQRLDMKDVKKIPALLGEVDVVRTIQLLPGVTTVGEGATGFNVRGGNIDQNLILLDDAPLYSSSHLFGFFSIFNPDAVKETKLM